MQACQRYSTGHGTHQHTAPCACMGTGHTFAHRLQLVLQLLLCVAAGQVAKVQLVLGLGLIQTHLQATKHMALCELICSTMRVVDREGPSCKKAA